MRAQVSARALPVTGLLALAAGCILGCSWRKVATKNWSSKIPNRVFTRQFVLRLEVQTISQETSCKRKLPFQLPGEARGLRSPSTSMQCVSPPSFALLHRQ